MRDAKGRRFKLIIVNLVVFVGLLVCVELWFRFSVDHAGNGLGLNNPQWQQLQPYVMFSTADLEYRTWFNEFTGKPFSADIRTNSFGFNTPFSFDYTTSYNKKQNEKVVLFTGGSSGWGVGATSYSNSIAGQMERHLNLAQSQTKYTVVNLAMGSWIAYQEFIALDLWGRLFDPDWIVVMDGWNDAGVGCAYSQGVGHPMYYEMIKSYIDGYVMRQTSPPFFRSYFENQLIKYSVAYRRLTGKSYVPRVQEIEDTDKDCRRWVIKSTPWEDVEKQLQFYLLAQRSILGRYRNAKYILSTQPSVNDFEGDFTDIYKYSDEEQRRKAIAKREEALQAYYEAYRGQKCGQKLAQQTYVYLFGMIAIEAEKLVKEYQAAGRADVTYYNTGLIFPNSRTERMPYFIDPAHLSDAGQEALGKYYAAEILRRDFPQQHSGDFAKLAVSSSSGMLRSSK